MKMRNFFLKLVFSPLMTADMDVIILVLIFIPHKSIYAQSTDTNTKIVPMNVKITYCCPRNLHAQ